MKQIILSILMVIMTSLSFGQSKSITPNVSLFYGTQNTFGADFITVTKIDESDWKLLKPEILMVIMDHLVSGLPVLDENKNILTQVNNELFSEIEKQIIEIIETRVRPSVAMDGGDIIYKGFKDGIVYLQLQGACSGCPSSSITLKNGIESMLQHYVPEVISVESIED